MFAATDAANALLFASSWSITACTAAGSFAASASFSCWLKPSNSVTADCTTSVFSDTSALRSSIWAIWCTSMPRIKATLQLIKLTVATNWSHSCTVGLLSAGGEGFPGCPPLAMVSLR